MSKKSDFNLEQINVANPCEVPWESMTGDERTRHCSQCKMSVFNISEMTRDEAKKLVEESLKGKRICAQFYRRDDGTIITKDCPVGRRKVVVKKAKKGSWALALSFFMSAFYAVAKEKSHEEHLSGSIRVIPVKGHQSPQKPSKRSESEIGTSNNIPNQDTREEKIEPLKRTIIRGKIRIIPNPSPGKK